MPAGGRTSESRASHPSRLLLLPSASRPRLPARPPSSSAGRARLRRRSARAAVQDRCARARPPPPLPLSSRQPSACLARAFPPSSPRPPSPAAGQRPPARVSPSRPSLLALPQLEVPPTPSPLIALVCPRNNYCTIVDILAPSLRGLWQCSNIPPTPVAHERRNELPPPKKNKITRPFKKKKKDNPTSADACRPPMVTFG